MARINLRDYYPDFYNEDYIIKAPEEVLEVLQESKRTEAAYQRKRYRYKAHYSLDCGDGIEHDALHCVMTPEEMYTQQEYDAEIRVAIELLPYKQASRIHAHYFLDMSITNIAEMEGVARSRVDESVRRGLHNLFILLKKNKKEAGQ